MKDSQLFKKFAKGKKTIQFISNNCIIYTRVSGSKQLDGLSLETQLKGNTEYAKRNKLNVREHFGGTYESAQTDERKEFQRMIKYLKTTKYKISKILVYSLERFSRNENSIWLSSQLRKLGTEIVSVTQPIDTTNPAGIMQQKMLFLFGEFDNQLRRQKSMAGVRERLLTGQWCAKPPIGYDILKSEGQRKIILNEKSKIIKKIFYWKAIDRLPNQEIKTRLLNHKVNMDIRRIDEILTNPFYCGMMVHKALEGEVLEGNHEKLITKEMFLTVNGILSEKKLGLQTKKERKEIALKRFMLCDSWKEPMRGYIAEGYDMPYYKCNTKGCSCNRNGNKVHEKFMHLLSGYSVNVKCVKLIEYQLKQTFTKMNASVEENQASAKNRVTDLNKKLERLEERYIIEELTGELYGKYKLKFETERDEIEAQISKNGIDMSRLDDYISVSLDYTLNLSKMWDSGDYTNRQELQNAFFPKGITYNRKKDVCREVEVNDFLSESADLSKSLATFTPEQLKKYALSPIGAGKGSESRSKLYEDMLKIYQLKGRLE